jgi:vacuolar protein sorting-associated protein 13D
VGTVTKPAVGVLDLASGTALAIRDSSKTSSRRVPKRLRSTRVISSGGILPQYSDHYSHGQEILFEINNRNYNEHLIGYETFKSGLQHLQILISSEHVRLLNFGGGSSKNYSAIMLDIHLK